MIKQLTCIVTLAATMTLGGTRPNVVMIMADDIGFSDIGCYGSEIQTPNLDALAENGLRFTQFYNMAKCNPTRSSLLSGLYLPRQHAENAVPFPNVLQDAGYYTVMCGKQHFDKWVPKHFKAPSAFEDSFVFDTCISYFVPTKKGQYERPFELNGAPLKPSEIEAEIKPLYKTDFITDYALRFLDKAAEGEQPFFLYLPYHAAHYPLQARPEDIAKYRGTYKAKGWDQIRAERLAKLKHLNLLDDSVELSEGEPETLKAKGMKYRPWDTLSAEEQDAMDLEMAVYAAMLDRLDQNVGRVVEKLTQMGELENTLILFFVDNGGCPYSRKGPGLPPGGVDSYAFLSPAWAHVGNTPFRAYKRYGHEGGCRSPFIAHWPGTIQLGINRSPAHLVDLYPTFLELAGTDYPADLDGKPTPSLDGTSMLPLLKGKTRPVPSMILSGFHNHHPMVRSGDWKLVREEGKPWELYNMEQDPTEQNNLSAKYPEKVQQMIEQLEKWKTE